MAWRHPNVGHHQLRCRLAHQREQLPAVTGLPDHVEARTVQQTGQTLPQQHIVLGHHHPHPVIAGCHVAPGRRVRGATPSAPEGTSMSSTVRPWRPGYLAIRSQTRRPSPADRRDLRHCVFDGGADVVGDVGTLPLWTGAVVTLRNWATTSSPLCRSKAACPVSAQNSVAPRL